MHLHLIAVGERMPKWVAAGFDEYRGRLPAQLALRLTELPLGHRGKGADLEAARAKEGERMLQALPKDARVVTLDAGGSSWTTEQLSGQLEGWLQGGRDVALLVGGPDGLSANCRARAEAAWSLSALTLPHMLVRIIVAEQIYRAWTVLQNHPYHR